MNSLSAKLATALVLLLSVSLCYADTPASKKMATRAKSSAKPAKTAHKSAKKAKHSVRSRGQKVIDGDRVRQIQQALVREHYMTAEPNGKWDAATQEAMRRYQADQGWQDKSIPDSRALIRLGLGPDQGHLLNPESAMTSVPLQRGSLGTRRGSATATSSAGIPSQSSSPVSTGGGLPEVTPSR